MARAIKAAPNVRPQPRLTSRRTEDPLVANLESQPELFSKLLRNWYRQHARDLPWRGIDDPYATWLSEIMLQQTRVATVMERYLEFLLRFPTLPSLAKAEESEVLALWSGLGYYRRARMLHRGAQFVMRELSGKLPRTADELRTLPGVGTYTAAAIASIAFGESIAVVDGNVERVLLRVLGRPEEHTAKARALVSAVAQSLVPPKGPRPRRSNPPGDHNQAMMELGATICVPRGPLCLQCPVVSFCNTRGEHVTTARAPQQSRTVAHLLRLRKVGAATEVLLAFRPEDAALMPGMLELPPLPLDAVTGIEPALRLRHSITNTNYYVQIYAESAPGVDPLTHRHDDHAEPAAQPTRASASGQITLEPEDEPFVADSAEHFAAPSLLDHVPSSSSDLQWVAVSRLSMLPLTGLARKALQRLRVMNMPRIEFR